MKASCDDEEEEEGQETLSSLVLPERWDVLGLGQAMVIPFSFLLHLFITIAVKLARICTPCIYNVLVFKNCFVYALGFLFPCQKWFKLLAF